MASNTDDTRDLELFSMGDAGIPPSEERRRLSQELRNSTKERISLSKRAEESDENETSIPPTAISSIRTSLYTDLFARSTTSDSFLEQGIKPTIIIALIYFKQPQPDISRLRNVLGERLLEIPRFSSIFRMKNNAVYCDGIPKETVDLKYHIQSIESSKNDDELSKLISDASTEWWDASKPLWKFTLVNNLKDGRSLLFCRIDHSIGDGVAMLAVLRSLLDDPPKETKSFQRRRVKPSPAHWSNKVVAFLSGTYDGLIGWAVKPTDPHNGLKIPSDKSLKDATDKKFSQTHAFPLEEIKELKSKLLSSSVNDIMMAVVTIGIRKYLKHINDPILVDIDKGSTNLQGVIVINARRIATNDQSVTNLGNDVLPLTFNFPLQYTDGIDAVWKSKAIVDQWKMSPQLFLQKEFSNKLLHMLPESALITATLESARKPTCMISNVMGPDFECTLADYVIDDLNFLTTISIGLYVGILSYNGKVRISFSTDGLANIDNSLLAECMEKSYDELRDEIRKEPKKVVEPPHMSLFSATGYYTPVFVAFVAVIFFFKFAFGYD